MLSVRQDSPAPYGKVHLSAQTTGAANAEGVSVTSHRPVCGLLVIFMLLLITTCAIAQDWPQWLGPNRDGKPAAFTPPQQWPTALARQWRVETGPGDGSPVLVGERLYVFSREGDEEVLRCLDVDDGSELWRDGYAAPPVTGPPGSHPGPRGTPCVAEGKVVTLGVAGTLSCLDAADGTLLWRKDPFPNAAPRFATGMSPMIVDGLAIAHLGTETAGALMAFDLSTGEVKWTCDVEGPQYASPVLMSVGGTGVLATLGSGSFLGVAVTDGRLLWQVPFPPQERAYNAATPVVSGDTVIISGAGRGTKAFRIAGAGGTVTATELWTNTEQGVQYNTPVLRDGLLFGVSRSGNLFCLRADTGQTAWVAEGSLGRGFGLIVDAGNALLVLPDNGMMTAYAPSADEFRSLTVIKVAEGGTYASPVLSANRIITRDQSAVVLWRLP